MKPEEKPIAIGVLMIFALVAFMCFNKWKTPVTGKYSKRFWFYDGEK